MSVWLCGPVLSALCASNAIYLCFRALYGFMAGDRYKLWNERIHSDYCCSMSQIYQVHLRRIVSYMAMKKFSAKLNNKHQYNNLATFCTVVK